MPRLDPDRRAATIAAASLAIAFIAIASTHSIFSGTFDEPSHVAAGMEWIDRGTFTYEPMNPPLARVAVALGPYLDGKRSTGAPNRWREGRNILYANGTYTRNLRLARFGVLPFFLLGGVVVWLWSRRLSGAPAAAAAVGLYATLPPILAHAGLATTDMAVAATVAASLLVFTNWLEAPTLRQALMLGVATGLAVLSKFSALLFLAAGVIVITMMWFASRRNGEERERRKDGTREGRTTGAAGQPSRIRSAALAVAALLFVVWAGYRFSFGPVTTGIPVPAPELWQGLRDLIAKNQIGHETYLLGEISTSGWWYFFPIALAVKTPIPFLILSTVGIASAMHRFRDLPWGRVVPGVSAIAIVVVSMTANFNIGLRHILPVYPLLAVAAAVGVRWLWHATWARAAARASLAVLLAWQGWTAARAYPDYLPWFNALAGNQPDRVLVNSDLDWGQDLLRLSRLAEALEINSLALAYFGSADPGEHFEHVRPMMPSEHPIGWFAVSVAVIKGLNVPNGTGFEWLEKIEPVAEVGRSIRLYYRPPGQDTVITPGEAVTPREER